MPRWSPLVPAAAAAALLATPAAAVDADAGFFQLRSDRAWASSFLKTDWNRFEENYHPTYALDDNPLTAWVEGVAGDGAGESLVLPVSLQRGATRVRVKVWAGYQKSAALLAANGAPKTLTVTVRAGGQVVASHRANLERKMGPQVVELAVPPGVAFHEVGLTVDEVHPGSKYKDTCISDVQVFVAGDVPYNAAVEQARFARVSAWAAARLADAKAEAAAPRPSPFAARHFTRTALPGDGAKALPADVLARVDALRALGAELQAQPWSRLAHQRPLPALPDGLWEIEALRGFFDPADRALFEAEGPDGPVRWEGPRDEPGAVEWRWGNLRVQRRPDGSWAAAAFHLQTRSNERSLYVEDMDWVLRFDGAGRLVEALGEVKARDEEGQAERLRLLRFELDAQGRVTAVQSDGSDRLVASSWAPPRLREVWSVRHAAAP